jgi:hypothetical protein
MKRKCSMKILSRKVEPAVPGNVKLKLPIGTSTVDQYSKWLFTLTRLLARRASRDAPRTKSGRLWTPKFWGKGKLFSLISLSILQYLKRNSFNSHYYYTFDILINLMVYLAE